ncbi:TraR/DksA family transcriptional regulator [Streptomyces brasiliensis]|uniref:Molecular chaperone DnaK n=1 Tax=Streptomyces brasiliensis TaxID=1954 RepID=A0A917L5A6_9ACTN|nr:TraR/DksA C4-type zinc finger protein [Streptomyces brasiliensis]GGJ45365.1 molecular chaperone DnaK [Streptomyces brasiliensis]
MSLDTSRSELPTADEARRRLQHARDARLIQLRALGETGPANDDPLVSHQKEAIRQVLQQIDEAFDRVEDGTYGTCLGCARPVPAERLEILPYTPFCVACQRHSS